MTYRSIARHRRFLAAIVCGAAALLPAASCLADAVNLRDGRRYEGTIVESDASRVRIDTMAAGVRVLLGFARADVESETKAALPAGFYDAPPAAARVSKLGDVPADATLYLEVPIIGAFGRDVVAAGLEPILTYAVRHRIPHLVFSIDSEGGSIDEAREMYELLAKFKTKLRYHAIIRRCTAEALAVGVWCRPGLLLPGAELQGLPPRQAEGDDADEETILRSQLAHRVIVETGATGHIAVILRALLDSDEGLAVWKDADGAVTFETELPEGVDKSKVLFLKEKGAVLSLPREKALALGMVDFRGAAADLGPVLGVEKWTAESDYGIKTMSRVAAERQRAAAAKEKTHERQVKRVATRRETVDAYIAAAIEQAATWDPEKATYSKYSEQYNWGYGWSGSWTANKWTPESQRKWKSRTDASMSYLVDAARGLKTMKRLDAEAVKLGLDPLYKPGQIDIMIRDLDARYKVLAANRAKTQE